MDGNAFSRRRFAVSVSRACVIAAGSAGLFGWAYRRQKRSKSVAAFSLSALEGRFRKVDQTGAPRLAVVRDKSILKSPGAQPDAEALDAALRRAFDALGGIDRFVRPGDAVLIKPNAGFAAHPSTGAVTDPGVVAAVIRQVKQAGAERVLVTDNPIATPHLVFERTGLRRAVEEAGGLLLVPSKTLFKRVVVPEAEVLPAWRVLIEPFLRVQVVIGIAAVKDHNLCGASLTLKNWYGLLGGRRSRFHQHIDETLCDLWRLVAPACPLLVLDGLRALMRNGPTGGSPRDVVIRNTLAIGTDHVATDSFGVTLLDRDPEAISYLKRAEDAGFGTMAYQDVWKEV